MPGTNVGSTPDSTGPRRIGQRIPGAFRARSRGLDRVQAAVANSGSRPNGDEQYHLAGDVPERTDYRNAALTGKAILAAVLTLDQR